MNILRVCAYKRVSVNFCVQCFSAKTEKKREERGEKVGGENSWRKNFSSPVMNWRLV